MEYKEMSCLAIHDISGVGQCALTVALPVLSTHTGGFTGFTYRDLTEDLLPMAEHWKQVGCRFQSLYSGFWAAPGKSAWWSRSSTGSGRKTPSSWWTR